MEQSNPYSGILLTDELSSMFADLILEHIPTCDVFLFIAERWHLKNFATIKDIRENVIITRRVGYKQRKATKFEIGEMNIDRKSAEKIVERLYFMSLVYIQPKLPYKQILLTQRGVQVVSEISKKKLNNT